MRSMPQIAAGSPSPIRRLKLADQVVGHVRDLIAHNQLTPGTRIVEGELCARLGVSRTPLREALKTLEGEGLIEFVAARGAVVRSTSPAELHNLLEVLTGLEAFSGRLACERAQQSEVDAIAALHDQMESDYTSRNRPAYFASNLAIHASIVKAAHNPEITTFHEQLSTRSQRMRYNYSSDEARWLAAMEEHRLMIAALKRRDGPALADILRRHIQFVWARLSQDLADRESRA
jgi:DNA-binding GntR family transcriptional regulator